MAEGNQTDEIAIYDAENGIFEVRVEKRTVWLSQAQLSELFQRDQAVISRHMSNAFGKISAFSTPPCLIPVSCVQKGVSSRFPTDFTKHWNWPAT